MRTEWLPLSASALVTGVMTLVLGTLLNPIESGTDAAQTLAVVERADVRWLAMAIMFFVSSVALTLGLPSMLSLFTARGRGFGVVGIVVFSVGVVGLAGYAMLMVFFKALVDQQAIEQSSIGPVTDDRGLSVFLSVWVIGFLLGIALIAVGLFRARRTPIWVPSLMLVFLVMMPFAESIGRVWSVLQMMALAAAFTGMATSATSPEHRTLLRRELA